MIGPFAVAIMERFGLRRTVCTALLGLALGVALTTAMREPWQMMLLWGVVVGTGAGMLSMVLGATVSGRWFRRRRGLVLGVLTASNATGQMVFLPFLARLAVGLGWRSVSLTVSAAALVMAVLSFLFLRDRPADMGLPPYGGTELEPAPNKGQNPAVRALLVLRHGIASKEFWLLAGSFFICGASANGLIGTHLIPACVDHGIPEVRAAGLVAVMGIFDLAGTTFSGWLSDRFDNRKLLAWYYALRGISLFFLPYSFHHQVYGLSLFAVFYGLDWVATVPPTVKLAAEAFGEENAVVMFGWIFASHQIGAAFAAWAAGLVRTETGNYLGAFLFAGSLCLLAVFLVLRIGSRTALSPGALAVLAEDVR
jgi:sugar phosphate permease